MLQRLGIPLLVHEVHALEDGVGHTFSVCVDSHDDEQVNSVCRHLASRVVLWLITPPGRLGLRDIGSMPPDGSGTIIEHFYGRHYGAASSITCEVMKR